MDMFPSSPTTADKDSSDDDNLDGFDDLVLTKVSKRKIDSISQIMNNEQISEEAKDSLQSDVGVKRKRQKFTWKLVILFFVDIHYL